jgi:hypothetical protein
LPSHLMYLLYYTTTRSAQKHIILFLFFIYLTPCTRSPVVDAVAFFSSLFSHHRYPFCHPLVSVSVSPPSVDEIESDHQNYVSAYHSAREHPPFHTGLPFSLEPALKATGSMTAYTFVNQIIQHIRAVYKQKGEKSA